MPFDYATDKPRAEAVLRSLCLGAHIDGIRFGPIPQLLITDHAPGRSRVKGQVYLNLASSWCVFPKRPERLPRGETEIEEPDETAGFRQLCELREAVIADIELGTDAPDLLLTFRDGRVFFLNDRHERYETWQFGIALAPEVGALVVACPGDQVAVWSLPASTTDERAVEQAHGLAERVRFQRKRKETQ